ncbi:hypothetical protein [Streptomyces sp. KN37]|uniref:hypothetical protein n=1 Tax=Streptomyces sp. KN37 TaxID=3090667 RepID=UPI002A74E64F|nr:hypothetical protein [Streptomyces sp. KN37]WPO69925.1 hypothetical protein R9806_04410 [Streptomyces sp. KN37]
MAMEGFFDGLEQAVHDRNWHAALVLSLTLPDICGKVEHPGEKSGARYSMWFDAYVGAAYKSYYGPSREEYVHLSGRDCYALRCSLLHEGGTDISRQSIRQALETFHFFTPGERGNVVHKNSVNERLYLMVDVFAGDVLAGARTWWASKGLEVQQAAQAKLLTLQSTDGDLAL